MVEIDARGLSCPEPVMKVKKASDSGEREIKITVTDFVAVENIKRFAGFATFSFDVTENDDEFEIVLRK